MKVYSCIAIDFEKKYKYRLLAIKNGVNGKKNNKILIYDSKKWG